MVRLSREQKEKVRKSILEVSRKYFLEDGYDGTSTKKIAKEVGIAEGTIFNYFDTKADIFLEALADGYKIESCKDIEIDLEREILDIIYEFIMKNIKPFLLIPKKVLREIGFASLKIAKKKPGLMRKLADLDYKAMIELEKLLQNLISRNMFMECDSKTAAESIYSLVMFEALIYVYEDEISKELMLDRLKEKLKFVINPYVIR